MLCPVVMLLSPCFNCHFCIWVEQQVKFDAATWMVATVGFKLPSMSRQIVEKGTNKENLQGSLADHWV